MKLVTSIKLIKRIKLIAAYFIGIGVYLFFVALDDYRALFFACIFFLIGAVLIVSKKILIKRLFTKTMYPGLLYGICEKLGYLRNLSIDPDDFILDDLYKPGYSTEEFLRDNQLETQIYPFERGGFGFMVLFGVTGWAYYMVMFVFDSSLVIKIIASILESFAIIKLIIGNKLKPDNTMPPIYEFTTHGLSTEKGLIEWLNIDNWEKIRMPGEGNYYQIDIKFKTAFDGSDFIKLPLDEIAISVEEFCMLMMYYQYKYGYGGQTDLA